MTEGAEKEKKMDRTWREYEDLARERPKPPIANYRPPAEPGIFAQICEWIARHWLLYLLIVTVGIASGCLLLDSVRR